MRQLLIYSRRWHRWGALLAALPLCITICTGLLLMQRGNFDWIQPKAVTGQAPFQAPLVQPETILQNLQQQPELGVKSWKDVNSLIFKPSKGTYQARLNNDYEVQLDASNGQVLKVRYRLSTLLIELHQGSFFHPLVMQWVFFPAGLILLLLWLTGLLLYFLPLLRRNSTPPSLKG